MTEPQPIQYRLAHEIAEQNQRKVAAVIPPRLVAKENRFLEEIRRAKVGPLKKLEMLYALMDELADAMTLFPPCKKGCSACCYYMVSVSDVEIAYIETHTKHRRNKVQGEMADFHGQPCPFLKNGCCSIYMVRPFVCRRHHALTPNSYWRHHDRSDRQFPLIGFTVVNQAFDEIRMEAKASEPADIRQYFGTQGDA